MDFSHNPAGLPPLGFTHGGRFHADDVFAAALLTLLRPDMRIYRGFEVPKGFSGIVFDVGDGEFDHHKQPVQRRENGVAYAAFGLLWRKYGHWFLSEEGAKRFDEKFVQPLDMDDNIGSGNLLAGLIGAFNPVWDATGGEDEAFAEAVAVAAKILEKRLESLAAVERGAAVVQKKLETMRDNILLLETYVPWKPVLVTSPAEFVVYPSVRGGYSVQCVPRDFAAKSTNKVPLPLAWRGQPAERLAELTGLADFTFCHASGFMATCGSMESVWEICRLAREDYARRQEQSRKDRERAAAENAPPAAKGGA